MVFTGGRLIWHSIRTEPASYEMTDVLGSFTAVEERQEPVQRLLFGKPRLLEMQANSQLSEAAFVVIATGSQISQATLLCHYLNRCRIVRGIEEICYVEIGSVHIEVVVIENVEALGSE